MPLFHDRDYQRILASWRSSHHWVALAVKMTAQFTAPLKANLKLTDEHAGARQLYVEINRIEVVVLSGEIQQPNRDDRMAAGKAVPRQHVELPEVVSGQIAVRIEIVLRGPASLELYKAAGRMVEGGVYQQALEQTFLHGRLLERCGACRWWHARIVAGEPGVAQSVIQTQRKFPRNDLVERRLPRPFAKIEIFREV